MKNEKISAETLGTQVSSVPLTDDDAETAVGGYVHVNTYANVDGDLYQTSYAEGYCGHIKREVQNTEIPFRAGSAVSAANRRRLSQGRGCNAIRIIFELQRQIGYVRTIRNC